MPRILYAFDLIEHDGEDMRNRPFPDPRLRWRGRYAIPRRASCLAEDGLTVFAHACRLGAERIFAKKIDGACRSGPCRVWIKVRNFASIAVQRERSEIWNR
jgi:bifunctional non-homologous end joining protein LigD